MLSNYIYKSFLLGKVKGIEFRIHWSFIALLLASIYFIILENKSTGAHLFIEIFSILFISVVIHELGHALSAKYLEIKPKDIIISALGGLARIESLKDKPKKEIIIAFSGPLANLIIFLFALLYVLFFTKEFIQISSIDTLLYTDYFSIAYKIGIVNFSLFSLNLIPAFPMDGGRILRGLLSLKLGSQKGTTIASLIGRMIALIFFILGVIFHQYGLIAISSLVYLMAARESYVDLNQT